MTPHNEPKSKRVCFKVRNYIPWNDISKNSIPTHVFVKNLDFMEMF
jgi:hypothetical protein